MFRSEIGSGFEDPGGTPPPRILRSTPPPPGGRCGLPLYVCGPTTQRSGPSVGTNSPGLRAQA